MDGWVDGWVDGWGQTDWLQVQRCGRLVCIEIHTCHRGPSTVSGHHRNVSYLLWESTWNVYGLKSFQAEEGKATTRWDVQGNACAERNNSSTYLGVIRVIIFFYRAPFLRQPRLLGRQIFEDNETEEGRAAGKQPGHFSKAPSLSPWPHLFIPIPCLLMTWHINTHTDLHTYTNTYKHTYTNTYTNTYTHNT